MPGDGASRARILDAARAEFAECGYAGARVARIARRARVNKQLLYYYFGSKGRLHEAASSPATVDTRESSARGQEASPPERLRVTVDHLFSELRKHPEVVALLVDRQGSREAETAGRAYVATVLGELSSLISEGQGLGYFGDWVDPMVTAVEVLVLCAGYLALERSLPETTRAHPGEWSAGVSAVLLKGIAW